MSRKLEGSKRKQQYSITINPDLHQMVQDAAAVDDVSVSKFYERLVKKWAEEHKAVLPYIKGEGK